MNLCQLVLIVSFVAHAAPNETTASTLPANLEADEQVLKAANLPATAPGLIDFFKKRLPTTENAAAVAPLIKQLTDKDATGHAKAMTDLIALGTDGREVVAEQPEDPYFWELKGQMMFENGKMEESVAAYQNSIRLLPNAPINLVSMSHAMVESDNPAYAEEAQTALKRALAATGATSLDPGTAAFAWDLLAKSYLQSNKEGMSAYAAAERAILLGQFGDVVRYTNEAEKQLPKDTPTWYRLEDIRIEAQNELRDVAQRRKR